MTKQIVTLTLSTLIGLGIALAAPQDQPAPGGPRGGRGGMQPPDPDRQVKMMQKQLNLTDDQAGQIKPILVDQAAQMQALRGDTSMSQEDRRAKMMSIRTDGAAKIRAILNDDQKAQYDKMLADRQAQMRQRMQGGDQGAPPPQQ